MGRMEEMHAYLTAAEGLPPEVRSRIDVSRLRRLVERLEAAPTVTGDDGNQKITPEWMDAYWPVIEAMDDVLAIMEEHASCP
jgi:hypothetical protein